MTEAITVAAITSGATVAVALAGFGFSWIMQRESGRRASRELKLARLEKNHAAWRRLEEKAVAWLMELQPDKTEGSIKAELRNRVKEELGYRPQGDPSKLGRTFSGDD